MLTDKIRQRFVYVVAAFVFALGLAGTTTAQLTSVEEAEAMSTKTGRPIFAVAGKKT